MDSDEELTAPDWQLQLEADLGPVPTEDSPFRERETKEAMLPPRKKPKHDHPLWRAIVLQPLGLLDEDFPTSGGRCNLCAILLLYSGLLLVVGCASALLGYLYNTLMFETRDAAWRQLLNGYLVLLALVSVGTISLAFFTYARIWCRKKTD